MLRAPPLQIGTNCTSQRRKIGLRFKPQQERARETSGSHGARAAGSCVREDARPHDQRIELERTESWELEGRNHALIDGSFSFFAIKDFSYRGLERYGDDHTGFGFESRNACFCRHKGQ
jgi:hypothetical protein